MTLDELFSRVEGVPVGARLGASSLFSTFLYGLTTQPEVSALATTLHLNKVAVGALVARIEVLAQREVDTRRANPYDIPLAAYLWLLEQTDRAAASIEAQRMKDVENLRWTRFIADMVLAARRVTGSTQLSVSHRWGAAPLQYSFNNLCARETLLRSKLSIAALTVASSVAVNAPGVQMVAGAAIIGASSVRTATQARGTANWSIEAAA